MKKIRHFILHGIIYVALETTVRASKILLLAVPLVQRHGLNGRQTKALGFLIQNGKLGIQDFEALCPSVNRRSLQRDLRNMMEKGLISGEGATHHQEYRLL
jgi:hypothetical protein